jgi:hypothetical protein
MQLQGPVHAVLPAGPLPGQPWALGEWRACAAPMQIYWLLPGDLQLPITSVRFLTDLSTNVNL